MKSLVKLTPVTMETDYRSYTDAVCQLRAVRGVQKILWGCFFNPQNDTSIDTMADEREAFLKRNNMEIVWD